MRFLLLLALSACAGSDANIGKTPVDNDGDGYTDAVDCDDAHATVNPDAPEVCDGADNDCDGAVDNDAVDQGTFYADADGDSAGDPDHPEVACEAPAGTVGEGNDCDDAEPRAFPGNPEVCDGVDNDCDGAVDIGVSDAGTWYTDADGDGWGDGATAAVACTPTGTQVAQAGDCDDTNAARSPDLPEVCDPANVDEDCDGLADDADPDATGGGTWYRDADSDGYGATPMFTACDAPAGYAGSDGDCNDLDARVNPGAAEVCDAANVDEDCDGLADDADPTTSAASWSTWYADADADGWGDVARPVTECEQPSGYVDDATDCQDTNAAVNPGAVEVCDGGATDEDCDGLVDDADPGVSGASTWYDDVDGDTWGGPTSVTGCLAPVGYVSTGTDCDDADGSSFPGGTEVCGDGVDQDCSGVDLVCPPGRFSGDTTLDSGYETQIIGHYRDEVGAGLVAGDFNGDGAGDLLVGAPLWGTTFEGVAFGYYGPFVAGAWEADAWDDVVYTHGSSGYSGTWGTDVYNLGDLDEDGADDLAIWAYYNYTVSLFSGGATGTVPYSAADHTHLCSAMSRGGTAATTGAGPEYLCAWSGYASSAGRVTVYAADGTELGTMTGEVSGDYAGTSLAGGQDIDGDGLDDYVVGAPFNDDGGSVAGALYLVYAPVTGDVALADADIKMVGSRAEYVGYSALLPGDLNDDGRQDVVTSGGVGGTGGGYYVVDYPASTTISAVAAAMVVADSIYDQLGEENPAAGDLDGDGEVDLVFADPWATNGTTFDGVAWLFYGPIVGTHSTADADARWTEDLSEAHFGSGVAILPDTNGDGLDDLAIGAYDWGDPTPLGSVWIWAGR